MNIKCLIFVIFIFTIGVEIVNSDNITNIIQPINSPIVIEETETLNLKVLAYDPDNTPVNITFSPPLNKEGSWQTTYGDAGNYDVVVTASDGELTTSEKVLVIVNKKEEKPTIDSEYPTKSELNVNEGSQIIFKAITSDINKDQITYRWSLDNNTVSEQSTFLFKPDYSSSGMHKITLVVSDGTYEVSKEWDINVNNVDRAPVFEPIETTYMNENEKIKVDLNAYDPDGDSVVLSAENLPEGALFSGQEFSWIPSYDTVKKDSVMSKTLSDFRLLFKKFKVDFYAKSNNKTVKRTLYIWVKDVDRPPKLEDISPIVVKEGESVTLEPKAIDPDGDHIKYSFSGWMNVNSYTTNYNDAGKYQVLVTASDGFLTDVKVVNITVKDTDRPPFLNLKSQDVYENEKVELKLNPTDPDGDFVNISSTGLPKSATLKGNILEWTPDYDVVKGTKTKNITVNFKLNDGQLQSEVPVVFVVHNTNRPPRVINATPEQGFIVYKNTKVQFNIMAEDPDGDPLQYLWDFGLLEKYNASNAHVRVFTRTGKKTVKVTVSDGKESVPYVWNVDVIENKTTAKSQIKTPAAVSKNQTVRKVQVAKPQGNAKKPSPTLAPKFKTYAVEE